MMNSFIHSGDLYSASLRHYYIYSEALPAKEGLEGDVKFGRAGHQQGTQLNGCHSKPMGGMGPQPKRLQKMLQNNSNCDKFK